MTTLTGASGLPTLRPSSVALTLAVAEEAVSLAVPPPLLYQAPPATIAPSTTTIPATSAIRRLRSLRSSSARTAAARWVRFWSRPCFDIVHSSVWFGCSVLGWGVVGCLQARRREEQAVDGERRPGAPREQQRERQQ